MFSEISSAKKYLLAISLIIAYDYLGPLFSSYAVIKIINLITILCFVGFTNLNKNSKYVCSLLCALLIILIPYSPIYSTILVICIFTIRTFQKMKTETDDTANDVYVILFTLIFIQLSLLYNTIPLVFNLFEYLSLCTTYTLSLGTKLGGSSSFFIPFIVSLVVFIITIPKNNPLKLFSKTVYILLVYLIFININIYLAIKYPIISTIIVPFEVIFIINLSYEKKTILRTLSDKTKNLNGIFFLIVLCLQLPLLVSMIHYSSNSLYKAKKISLIASEEKEFIKIEKEIERDNILGFGNSPFIFSSFKIYLEALGHTIEIYDSISDVDYSNTDILLLVHFNSSTNKKDKDKLEKFIKKGGTVITFNDHNNLFNASKLTNDLLDFSNIKINDDISDNLLKESRIVWKNSLYEFMSNPMKTKLGLSNENNLGVWGGASVSTRDFFATPLIIAKYGISDPSLTAPNLNGEYMGNRKFNHGETYGNIPLGYAVTYGLGRVVLYGDASYIQTPQAILNWNFLYNTFDISDRLLIPNFLQILCVIIIVFTICIFYFYSHISNKKYLIFSLLYLTTLVMTVVLNAYILDLNKINIMKNISGKYNIIDMSHENYISETLIADNSIAGIGYISITQKQPSYLLRKTMNADILKPTNFIIINPQKELDVLQINKLLDKDINIIIIAGKEYYKNINKLLEGYDVYFSNEFLGPIPWKNPMIIDENVKINTPEFKQSWNIEFNKNKNVSSIFKYKDYVPAVCINTKKGKIYLIADSHFLDNNNIEGEFSGNIHNIKFIETIINSN